MLFKIFFTLVVVIGLVFLFRAKRIKPPKETDNIKSDNSTIPNAFRTKTSGLNINEQALLKCLQEVIKNKPVQIFPKPQLATFISLDPNLAPEIQARLSKELMQISCDFMLVDQRTFSPIVALDTDPTQDLTKLLTDLNIPLVALLSNKQYDQKKLEKLLIHYL